MVTLSPEGTFLPPVNVVQAEPTDRTVFQLTGSVFKKFTRFRTVAKSYPTVPDSAAYRDRVPFRAGF
jgi:hypothetical protein